MSAGWTAPGDWWSSAVDAVTEAVADRRDPAAAASRLGRQRAEAGVGLAETLDDLRQLAASGGLTGTELVDITSAAAIAWADVAVLSPGRGADDALTGLATTGYVRNRLAELYREAARTAGRVADDVALVVVGWRDGPGWTGIERSVRAADVLRTVFSGGETLARLQTARLLGVVPRDDALHTRVQNLRRLFDAGLPDAFVRVWIEPAPPTLAAAGWLIDDLVEGRAAG